MSVVFRAAGAVLALSLLSACAGKQVITPTESGTHKPDGVVTMSSSVSLFHPYTPDWSVAQARADKRCRGWGYERAESFTGSREFCKAWDRRGRCIETRITRYYECTG